MNVIHIGVHKTGSTAIQRCAAENTERFRAVDVLYPASGRPDNPDISFGHHELAWAISGRQYANDPWQQLSQERESVISKQLFLISEEFARFDAANIQTLFDYVGENTKIVFFYRRQSDVLQGMFGTDIVYNEETSSIKDYVARNAALLDYYELAHRWAGVFGRDHVLPIPYQPPGRQVEPLTYVLLRTVGLDQAVHQMSLPETIANKSVPWFVALAIQQLWKLGIRRDLVYRAIASMPLHLVTDVPKGYQFLPPSQAAAVDEIYSESNRKFHAEFCRNHEPLESAASEDGADWLEGRFDAIAAVKSTLELLLGA